MSHLGLVTDIEETFERLRAALEESNQSALSSARLVEEMRQLCNKLIVYKYILRILSTFQWETFEIQPNTVAQVQPHKSLDHSYFKALLRNIHADLMKYIGDIDEDIHQVKARVYFPNVYQATPMTLTICLEEIRNQYQTLTALVAHSL